MTRKRQIFLYASAGAISFGLLLLIPREHKVAAKWSVSTSYYGKNVHLTFPHFPYWYIDIFSDELAQHLEGNKPTEVNVILASRLGRFSSVKSVDGRKGPYSAGVGHGCGNFKTNLPPCQKDDTYPLGPSPWK